MSFSMITVAFVWSPLVSRTLWAEVVKNVETGALSIDGLAGAPFSRQKLFVYGIQ